MKTMARMILVATAAAAALAIPSAAAQRPRSGSTDAGRKFDPKTVETIEGKILSIEKTTPPQSHGYGIHLTLQTNKETISVHLGPSWFLEKQSPQLQVNDAVVVTGSRITIDGKAAIIAAQVKKGNDTLKLRDESGTPAWSRGGGRTP